MVFLPFDATEMQAKLYARRVSALGEKWREWKDNYRSPLCRLICEFISGNAPNNLIKLEPAHPPHPHFWRQIKTANRLPHQHPSAHVVIFHIVIKVFKSSLRGRDPKLLLLYDDGTVFQRRRAGRNVNLIGPLKLASMFSVFQRQSRAFYGSASRLESIEIYRCSSFGPISSMVRQALP